MLSLGIPLVLIAAGLSWFNFVRFGSVLETGYGTDGAAAMSFISWRFVEQSAAVLISPAFGVFLYCPPLLIGLFGILPMLRRFPVESALLLAVFALNFALMAAYRYVGGGWSWGPRLLLPSTPLLIPFVGYGFQKLWQHVWLKPALVVVCAAGVFFNTAATLVTWQRYLAMLVAAEPRESTGPGIWSVRYSQILNQPGNAWEVLTMTADERAKLFYDRPDHEKTFRNSRSLNLPDLWWVRLSYEGVPKIAVYPAMLGLLAAGILSWCLLLAKLKAMAASGLIGPPGLSTNAGS